jgi:hypothetical protein
MSDVQNNQQVADVTAPEIQARPDNLRRVLHVQVAGNPSSAELSQVATAFVDAIRAGADTVTATNQAVQLYNVMITDSDPIDAVSIQGAITVETIAKTAHEVNQAYLQSSGEVPVLWAEASVPQRESMVRGVLTRLKFPAMTAEQQHQAWYDSKAADGWTFGEVKDEVAKTNPAFVAYAELPQAQRVKDFLFAGVVNSLKDRLPQPTQQVRAVEVLNLQTSDFEAYDFFKLEANMVFRFTGQPEVYRTNGVPFIDYSTTKPTPDWSIDAQAVTLTRSVSIAEYVPETEQQVEHALDEVVLSDEEDASKLKDWVAEDGVIKQPAAEWTDEDTVNRAAEARGDSEAE